jgi:uncharacterized membrane protein YkvA (DUF1232 family)
LSNLRLIARWKGKVSQLKVKVYVLYLAYKDPRVPWYAKAFAACIVGYALSPIDLIPDFIPVLGYVDDLVLIPLGIALALKMIPDTVLQECEKKAQMTLSKDGPKNSVAAAIIVAIWLLLIALFVALVFRIFYTL